MSDILRGRSMVKGRPPKTFKPGRRCDHPECPTVLSIYNPTERCRAHATYRKQRIRGKKTAA